MNSNEQLSQVQKRIKYVYYLKLDKTPNLKTCGGSLFELLGQG